MEFEKAGSKIELDQVMEIVEAGTDIEHSQMLKRDPEEKFVLLSICSFFLDTDLQNTLKL